MLRKTTFRRSAGGGFDLSEDRLRTLLLQLGDSQEPRIPESLARAAAGELVRRVHASAERSRLPFDQAARNVVRTMPNLFKLTRGLTVADSEPADVEVLDDE